MDAYIFFIQQNYISMPSRPPYPPPKPPLPRGERNAAKRKLYTRSQILYKKKIRFSRLKYLSKMVWSFEVSTANLVESLQEKRKCYKNVTKIVAYARKEREHED